VIVAAAVAVIGEVDLRGSSSRHAASGARPARPTPLAAPPFSVHEVDLTYVDATRSMSLRDGSRRPRRLVTRVLYPVPTPHHRLPVPFPLLVFGHGYALSPGTYRRLLTAWARAGYVVAAPVFPLENSAAPGGPNEADLSNQPADMSFVITRLLASSKAAASPLHGLLNADRVAVAGHSDGGDSALAVAEGPNRDHRVTAAVVLAGAELPGLGLDTGGPPLLAMQGTDDRVNAPSATDAYFSTVAAPKFLVRLLGARHVAPYSRQGPQLSVVTRVTLAFLDRYVKGDGAAAARMAKAASVPGVAVLTSDP
jgi:dienelactone hydrolase